MRKGFLFLTIFFSFLISYAQTPINLGTTTVEWTTLYTTTDLPWELKFGPGDSLWMTTREGRVYRVHPINGGATLLLDHSANVWQVSESGMLGMAFHPDFTTSPQVFIAYTYTSGGLNRERLSRFNYSGNSLSGEVILIDGGNIVATNIHNGSRLLVLPDNTILMTTGDAANTANSQNNASLNGKIIRANLNGSIPVNNPDPASLIFTKGHRNPQGLALHPNGIIFETEHGPGNNDEFQIIEAGRNYGWPNVEGYCDNDIGGGESAFCIANNIKEPLASWLPAPGGTWAPSDLIWYTHASIPEFQNSFLVAFLKTNKVRRITLNVAGDAITSQTDFFAGVWGRLRDITATPNGDLFLATNTTPYRIIRIRNPLAPLPVIITDYKTACNNNNPVIQWRTQAESNNKQFLLYRSTNSVDFQLTAVIPTKAPGGNSNTLILYNYIDNSSSSKSFYKLVSEDINGRVEDFGILSASCKEGMNFKLSPNPAYGQTKLSWADPLIKYKIKVFTSTGQLVYQTNANSPVVLPVSKWAADLYVVTASDEQNIEVFKGKLIIRR